MYVHCTIYFTFWFGLWIVRDDVYCIRRLNMISKQHKNQSYSTFNSYSKILDPHWLGPLLRKNNGLLIFEMASPLHRLLRIHILQQIGFLSGSDNGQKDDLLIHTIFLHPTRKRLLPVHRRMQKQHKLADETIKKTHKHTRADNNNNNNKRCFHLNAPICLCTNIC